MIPSLHCQTFIQKARIELTLLPFLLLLPSSLSPSPSFSPFMIRCKHANGWRRLKPPRSLALFWLDPSQPCFIVRVMWKELAEVINNSILVFDAKFEWLIRARAICRTIFFSLACYPRLTEWARARVVSRVPIERRAHEILMTPKANRKIDCANSQARAVAHLTI